MLEADTINSPVICVYKITIDIASYSAYDEGVRTAFSAHGGYRVGSLPLAVLLTYGTVFDCFLPTVRP